MKKRVFQVVVIVAAVSAWEFLLHYPILGAF